MRKGNKVMIVEVQKETRTCGICGVELNADNDSGEGVTLLSSGVTHGMCIECANG